MKLEGIELKEIGRDLYDLDTWMDAKCGEEGTPQREQFRKEAYAYCVGRMIHDARKQEKITQSELAKRIGSTKSYISRIENGTVEPGAGLFLRIISALGLTFDISHPIPLT